MMEDAESTRGGAGGGGGWGQPSGADKLRIYFKLIRISESTRFKGRRGTLQRSKCPHQRPDLSDFVPFH